MKSSEFVSRAKDAALNHKTLYVMGCFGAPLSASNKKRYTQNNAYNKRPARTAKINAATADTFGFDCVCLIKGILWGWTGDKTKQYGGAKYASNGVPDIGEDKMIALCSDVSTDFTGIVPGAMLWMSGHCGIYIGNGLAVESTPIWADGVQITAVGNIGAVKGYKTRTWTKWGKLPYVEYEKPVVPEPDKLPDNVKWVDILVDGIVKQARGILIEGNWYIRLRDMDEQFGVIQVSYDPEKKMPVVKD